MSNVRDIGHSIGRALAKKPEPQVPDTNVSIDVDTAPIAAALASLEFPALDVSALVEALARIKPADLSGVINALDRVAKASATPQAKPEGDKLVASAIDRNTAAIEANTVAVEAQTAVLLREKTVTYDEQGRVTRVKTV